MGRLQEILTVPLSKEEFYETYKRRIHKLHKSSLEKKTAYIIKHLPEILKKTLEEAEFAVQGRLVLPGTGGKPYFVENPPAWYENPVQDEEYVWGLNRMLHWKTLMEAFCLTKNTNCAEKVVEELLNWISECPRPDIDTNSEAAYKSFYSVDPWRSLEVGIRMFESWPVVVKHLLETEYFTPELLEKITISIHEHGEVLEKICPVFWPKADHNHYLHENLGLLAVACNFPELKKSRQWMAHAMKELERCAIAQITDDGGQIEGCPGYHNGCVYFFCMSIIMAGANGLAFSTNYTEKICKSLDYSVYSLRPSGTTVPWGDSDADKSAVKSATFGYLAFGETKWLNILAGMMGYESLLEELNRYIWEIPDMEALVNRLKQAPRNPSDDMPLYNRQYELSQVAMRTDWTRDALSIFFVCRTPVYNGHAHIDPMSFDFTAYSKALVVDPGRFTYREDSERRLFKSASMHSTLTIDEKEPFEYISTWDFAPQKLGVIKGMYSGQGNTSVEAIQMNYEPVVHKRLVSLVDSSLLLVLDQLEGMEDNQSVQIYYHLDSMDVILQKDKFRAYTNDEDVNILIQTSSNLEGTLLEGRISEFIDISKPSTRLCFSDGSTGKGTSCYAAVLVPYRLKSMIPDVSRMEIEKCSNYNLYKFECSGKQYRFLWGQDKFERI